MFRSRCVSPSDQEWGLFFWSVWSAKQVKLPHFLFIWRDFDFDLLVGFSTMKVYSIKSQVVSGWISDTSMKTTFLFHSLCILTISLQL